MIGEDGSRGAQGEQAVPNGRRRVVLRNMGDQAKHTDNETRRFLLADLLDHKQMRWFHMGIQTHIVGTTVPSPAIARY